MPPRTAIVVGNGLTIDLIASSDPALFTDWHPSRPLSWAVRVEDGRPLRDCLPHFFTEVDAVLAAWPHVSDFTVVDRIVKLAEERRRSADALGWRAGQAPGYEAGRLDTEARHFLGIAYSALEAELQRRCSVDEWRWLRYIEGLGKDLLAVMSFNYDTSIERTLTAGGIPFFHCGVEPQAGMPLGKPHGSIDYAMAPGGVHIDQPPAYPINIVMQLIDVPMRRLPVAELARPRHHVEVVPPMAASKIRHFQWVWPIFDAFRQLAPAIERCVFAGLSGWPVDQPELRDVLRVLNPATEVVVANPDSRALIMLDFHVRRFGLPPATHWRNGP
jgi:hypothetical protein